MAEADPSDSGFGCRRSLGGEQEGRMTQRTGGPGWGVSTGVGDGALGAGEEDET